MRSSAVRRRGRVRPTGGPASGRRGRLYLHTVMVGAGQAGAQLVAAVVFVVLVRSMDVGSFGHVAAIYGVAMLASILTDFGASSLWTRNLAAGTPLRSFAISLRSRITLATGVLLVLATATLCLGWAWTGFWVVAVGIVVGLGRIATSPSRADNQLGRLALVTVGEKVLLLVEVLALAPDLSATTFLMAAAAAACVSLTANVVLARRPGLIGALLPGRHPFVNPFRGTLHLGLGAVAVGVQALDFLVLQVAAGSHVAGIYAAVGRWTQPMGLLASAVTQGNFADMSRAEGDLPAQRIMRRSVALLAVGCIPIACVGVFAEPLVTVLLGTDYRSSAQVLRLLAVASMLSALGAPLVAFLQARGGERWTARVLLVLVPVQMAAMALAAAVAGAQAAAAVIVLVQVVLLVLLGWGVRHHVRARAGMPVRR